MVPQMAFVDFKMHQEPFSIGVPPRSPLGELTTLPQAPLSDEEGTPLTIPLPLYALGASVLALVALGAYGTSVLVYHF